MQLTLDEIREHNHVARYARLRTSEIRSFAWQAWQQLSLPGRRHSAIVAATQSQFSQWQRYTGHAGPDRRP